MFNCCELLAEAIDIDIQMLLLCILSSCSPKLVADAVLLLVQDASKVGAIARVTPRNGIDFHKFDKKPLLALMQKL